MNGQQEDQPARKRSSRLPMRAPQVDFRQVAGSVGERAMAVLRWFGKDPMNTGLIIASLFLTILFFNLLGDIQPSSSGEKVPLSRIDKLAKKKQIETAALLDELLGTDPSIAGIKALVAQAQKRSAVYDIITNPTNVSVQVR